MPAGAGSWRCRTAVGVVPWRVFAGRIAALPTPSSGEEPELQAWGNDKDQEGSKEAITQGSTDCSDEETSSALRDPSGRPPPPAEDQGADFCMETATLLAGFAFECYNQPSLTWEEAPDDTRTGMLSPAFLREYYDGVLAIDAVKAELFRPSGMLPMVSLDTYLVLQVTGGGQPVRCETARGTEPRWDSGRFLYVRGEDAVLSVSIYYEAGVIGNKEPRLMGRVNVAVSELHHKSIQLWGEKRPLSGSSGGRLELKAQYVPFSDSGAEQQAASLDFQALATGLVGGGSGGGLAAISEQLGGAWSARRARKAVESTTGVTGGAADGRRGSRLTIQGRELGKPSTWFESEAPRGPRGAAGVDWSDLGQVMGGAASAGDAFEAVCFVESTRTNTQCGFWRQAESRTLVLSFRGTQQDTAADIITDLSFAQQPATLKAHEVPVAAAPAEVLEAAERLEGALAAALASVRAGDLEQALLSAGEVEGLRAVLARAVEGNGGGVQLIGQRDSAGLLEVDSSGNLEAPALARPMVHSGFYSALKSVLPRCLALVEMLTTTEDGAGGWTVYVTGHSLGGALATLMSWEIEALRERDLPAVSRVVMYNFGSPRVGNTAFSQSYNDSIKAAFRVVNNEDIVGRVPSSLLPGGDWLQVGRTVLVRQSEAAGEALWVQGREPDGTHQPCPLTQDSAPAVAASGGGVSRMALLRSALLGQGVADHMEDAYHAAMASAIEAWKKKQQRRQGQAEVGAEAVLLVDEAEVDNVVREELAAALAAAEGQAASGQWDTVAAGGVVERIKERVATNSGSIDEGSPGSIDEGPTDAAVNIAVRRELQRRLTRGEWDLRDLSLLLRVALTLGANLTPAAGLLPVRVLLTVYATTLQAELGERLLAELQLAVAQRVSQGVAETVKGWTGKEGYEFGDLTRTAVAKATGKDEYEFGDLSRAVVRGISQRLFSDGPSVP